MTARPQPESDALVARAPATAAALPAAASPRERLSAAMDGDADALGFACAAWRDEAAGGLRADWHAYHLIGDVLRSSDLAAPASRDAAFLAALRGRLAAEPVVLAPPAPPARRRWAMPAAAAASVAGVAVVAGALVMTRPDEAGVAPRLATGAPLVQPTVPAVAVGGMLRDEQLDEFLRVHQGARSGVALPLPPTRPATLDVIVPAR